MRLLLHMVLALCLLATGCSSGRMRQLSRVDTLVCRGMLDSASVLLSHISEEALDDGERAYADLLGTMISYRLYEPIASDSVIDRCVSYYRGSGDKAKAGEAYFYQGMIKHLLGKTDEAIVSLKRAEMTVAGLNDTDLSHKVYNGLLTVNYASANYELALEYAWKELRCSEAAENNYWTANAYNHLSCVYERLGKYDSALYFIRKLQPYIDAVPQTTRAYLLSNVGLYYLHIGDTVKAKSCLTESYRDNPLPETSNMLARIYFAEGKRDSASHVWNGALKNCGLEGRIKIKEAMAGVLYKAGCYKESGQVAAEAGMLKDSLDLVRQTNKIQKLQLDYDHRMAAERRQRVQTYSQIALFVLAVAAVVGVVVYYRRSASRKGLSVQLIIEEYKRKIRELEASGQSMSQEMAELKHKLAEAETKKIDTLVSGRLLYERIVNGETTALWNKADFLNFIAYYQVVNPDMSDRLDACYDNLSPANKFFLILQDMGYDNDGIRRILCFSTGAMRAARFRIKSKMKRAE